MTTEPAVADQGDHAGSILVVEDEPDLRRLIERFLKRHDYLVDTVRSVPDAVGMLAMADYDLVITDLRLPGPSGLDMLMEVRSRFPNTRLILMSGHADVSAAAAAIDRGVDSLIVKPFELDELKARVDDSLQRRRCEHAAAHELRILEARIRQRDTESRVLVLRAAHSLAAAVEAKDAYTAGHAVRVTAYAMAIAEEVGNIDLLRFRLAGDLHDIGKIGIPDHILNKPGRLTAREMERVREHPGAGARILDPLIDDPMVLGVVRWHHERWDGRGYPDKLAGANIPLAARVLAVADTLDAMTSHRAYRPGLPWEVATDEVYRCAGDQFDPGVVEAFDAVKDRLQGQYERFRAQEGSGVGAMEAGASVPS
jgi:putative two-component system response regulator